MILVPAVPTVSAPPLGEAAATRAASQSHVPGVDGLRCFAVLAVMLFHAGLSKTGWAGVWLFFVISGFVITRSLMANAALGLPAKEIFRRFYLKRSFRILPLYLGSLCVFTLVIVSFSADWGEKLDHLPWLLTFTYNFYRLDSDYVHNDFFGHFWSLSVEEQFYLVYPALLVGLGMMRLRYALIAALAVAPVLRLLVSLIYGAITPEELYVDRAFWRGNAVYQFGLTQFDAFAIGALIALHERRIRANDYAFPAIASVALGALAVYAAIYLPVFGGIKWAFHINIDGHYAEVWLYSVLDLLAAALVIAVLTECKPVLWLCTRKIPQHLGRISFGIYVFHLPIIGVIGERSRPLLHHFFQANGLSFLDTSFVRLILFGGLSVIVAHLSYSHYERPLLKLGERLINRSARAGLHPAPK
jgi:peptidoglycan/LPS O-acetylase OafA/YrhL